MPARKSASSKKTASEDHAKALKLRITLLWSEPPVWREVLVAAATSLDSFMHLSVQLMGWDGSHPHKIMAGKRRFPSDPSAALDDDSEPDATEVTLGELLPRKGSKFYWIYDFGDNWEHEVRLIERMPPPAGMSLPVCTDGAGACPPDDCGGIPGYERLLEIAANPRHPERDSILDWLGSDFDPGGFSVAEANERLG